MSDLVKGGLAAIGALFVIMLVFTYVFGGRSEPDFTRLEVALSLVPQSVGGVPFTSQPIEFADYSGSRQAAGLEQSVGLQAFLSLPQDDKRTLYQGLPNPGAGLRDHEAELFEKLAIDLYAFDLGVWVIQPDLLVRNFMVLQGAYDKEEIVNRLLGLGYKEAQHNEVNYYWLFEEADIFEDPKVDLSHPLGTMAPYVNRVAFVDDLLLIGSNDVVIKTLIDVQLGNLPSLREDRGYIRLARASGLGVLGGVFLDYRWLQNTWSRFPEQYLEVPDTWESLVSYRLVLLGYRETGESGEMVVAFIHARTNSAERNAAELEKRWSTFDVQTSRGTDLVTKFCSPYSTSVIERLDKRQPQPVGSVISWAREYSVLTGTCRVTESNGSDVAIQGPGLWRTLYETEQLTFLVDDT